MGHKGLSLFAGRRAGLNARKVSLGDAGGNQGPAVGFLCSLRDVGGRLH